MRQNNFFCILKYNYDDYLEMLYRLLPRCGGGGGVTGADCQAPSRDLHDVSAWVSIVVFFSFFLSQTFLVAFHDTQRIPTSYSTQGTTAYKSVVVEAT